MMETVSIPMITKITGSSRGIPHGGTCLPNREFLKSQKGESRVLLCFIMLILGVRYEEKASLVFGVHYQPPVPDSSASACVPC